MDRPAVSSRLLLVVIFAVLALAVGVLTFSFLGESAAREQVRQTTQVLTHLRGAMRAGLSAETGQRGYLLTGAPAYLTPYTSGRIDWIDELDALAAVIEADHVDDVAALRDMAEEKLAELAETVDLANEGRSGAALAIVTSDRGKRLMDEYRRASDELEATRLARLDDAADRAQRRNVAVIVILLTLGLVVIGLILLSLSLERRTVLAEAASRDMSALRAAREKSDLLARELDHRVKNLFAVVMAIISRSRGAEEESTEDVLAKLRKRIHALSVAHSVSTGQLEQRVASIEDLVHAALDPYDDGSTEIRIDGPAATVSAGSITSLGLILHELATNAAKYGALSTPSGTLDIAWREDGPDLHLTWRERGAKIAPDAGEDNGFGSVMMRASARQIGGELERTFEPDGILINLRFPLDGLSH
ncbi:CHASE3 domain-containing protein [Roseobacter sp. HKCCA0434]|uniref:CHASE3 domain-containing protein n=1 Tax=Roseobacter sp. HKCCA0434 TaxID=3079297 RepID=UPI002905ACE8|nr:CHASE3 domain-containing protein [Roseobacter sp. HKCCA0434]